MSQTDDDEKTAARVASEPAARAALRAALQAHGAAAVASWLGQEAARLGLAAAATRLADVGAALRAQAAAATPAPAPGGGRTQLPADLAARLAATAGAGRPPREG